MKRLFIGAALLASVLILFFIVWNGRQDAARELAPPEEQIVTIYGETLPEQPNVLLAIDPSSQTILSHLYEGLYRFGKDGTVEPGLVEEMTRSDDGSVYTFKLKTSQTLNGEAITAETFVNHFRTLADDDTNSPFSFFLEDVVNGKKVSLGTAEPEALGVKALDASTFEVTLERPMEGFEEMLAMPAFLPQTVIDEWTSLDGNGPFQIESIDAAQVTLVKNEQYHMAENVTLERVVIQTEPALGVESSGMHLVPYGTTESELDSLDGQLVDVPRSGVFYLKPNVEQYPFNDVEFRRSLALSLDRDAISPKLARAEQTTERLLVLDSEPSGYVPTGDANESFSAVKQKLEKETFDIELLSFVDDEARQIAQTIKQQFEQLDGLTVTITELPLGEKVRKEVAGNYALSLSGWQPDYPALQAYLTQFETSNYLNSSGYADETFDRLMAVAQATESKQARDETYRQAEQHLLEEAVVIPIYQAGRTYAVDDQYEEIGFPVIGPSYVLHFSKIYKK
ncbi:MULTISPECIES: peptide ABC transporter substrate-binding protein [Exiguobacterium]|uniref:peptide ABC transporter substrate-binding protein n=1 Tax=Exiguobacterium TaxID=33986 RepID=UPI001BE9D8E5|nr:MULTISPECIES: peptide ABC transporter substrate-binding protein [Exiguobacterium]MCT4781917.1 peptide ABC transporter substrate-binding protein [Exiguobacterium himgiriensis]